MVPAALRLTFWGKLEMGVNAGVGALVGTVARPLASRLDDCAAITR